MIKLAHYKKFENSQIINQLSDNQKLYHFWKANVPKFSNMPLEKGQLKYLGPKKGAKRENSRKRPPNVNFRLTLRAFTPLWGQISISEKNTWNKSCSSQRAEEKEPSHVKIRPQTKKLTPWGGVQGVPSKPGQIRPPGGKKSWDTPLGWSTRVQQTDPEGCPRISTICTTVVFGDTFQSSYSAFHQKHI